MWNTPRDGFKGHPINPDYVEDENSSPTPQFTQIKATFKNSGSTYPKADLYYNDETFWSALNKDEPPVNVNTYETHKWDVKVDGKTVKSWSISEKDGELQSFTI